jgi:hypothetical protein
MLPYSGPSSASYCRLQIRLHDVGYPADLCESVDLIDRGFTGAKDVSERFYSDINSDLVSVLEAIGHCLRSAVNMDLNSLDFARLDSLDEGRAGPEKRTTLSAGDATDGLWALKSMAIQTSCGSCVVRP